MSHTPGPWEVKRGAVCSSDGEMIADTSRSLHADTILIAAAPELLEAAKQYLSYVDPHLAGDFDVVGDELREAIAKAEGAAE